MTEYRPPSWTDDEAQLLARAQSAKRQLESLVDRILASGSLLDPEPLAELGRFLDQEAYPAACGYAALLHSRFPTPSSPRQRGGGK